MVPAYHSQVTSSGERPRQTPLHMVHERLGATMTSFAGWQMPLRYGSETAEHHPGRRAAGVVPDGPVAAGREGAESRVTATPANTAPVVGALADRAAGHDAEVTDVTGDYALIAVQGPAAAGILAPLATLAGGGLADGGLADGELAAMKYYAGAFGEVAGAKAWVARTGYTGEDGFEIYCRPEDAEHVWTALASGGTAAGGTAAGLVPAGLAARDTLRLWGGM